MKVVAVIACRNEAPYMANCLRHLVRNGIDFVVIDNESTDETLCIVERPEFRNNLVTIGNLPYEGEMNLTALLSAKQDMIERLDTDWVVHLDADEILHSSQPNETLLDAMERIDRQGANAINFEEFVFLPVDADYQTDCEGFQKLRHYYFFEPKSMRLMRAFKPGLGFNWGKSGGHNLQGAQLNIASENFVLRHYIFLNQEHAYNKYSTRKFSEIEVQQLGWHRNRVDQSAARFKFLPSVALEKLASPESTNLSKARPFRKHYWES